MAISKLNFNSINVTPSASSAIGFDSGADDLETGSAGGAIKFIKKLTASSSSTLSFVDGASSVVLDNTYKEYIFTYNNIHPASDNVQFQVGFRDGGTDYDAVKTTTHFYAYNNEAGTDTAFGYGSGGDLAQSTAFQRITDSVGNDNDQCCSGYLHLFNPSSTTFVKHFISTSNLTTPDNYTDNVYVAGYCNTTSAVDALQFKFSSGNIDAGTITLYGIS